MMDQIAQSLSLYHVTTGRKYVAGTQYDNWIGHYRYTITGTQEGRELVKRRIAELDV